MLNVRVSRRTALALDICSFELIPTDETSLPPFSAGSHIDVVTPGGLTRQYSLCNDERDNSRYVIGVLRDPSSKGGSAALHEQVEEGSILQISAPRNHFALAQSARHSVLLAGGIGVTPLLSMASSLSQAGASFDMHYCARSRERAAFVDTIRDARYASQVHFHFDDGPDEQRFDLPACLATPLTDTHLYVCGPKPFMDVVLETARKQGWADHQLHYEFFSGTDASPLDSDESFDVQIASTGQIVRVARGESVAQALIDVGVEIETSCAQGVCGTCLTRVLSGVPDHRDMFLSPSEQAAGDQFLPCCSRSKSPLLVLDI
jgi:vanillate O-demethylase ferredoxin subunit